MIHPNQSMISLYQKCCFIDSRWFIASVVDHTINISKQKPLSGNNYIKLPKELDHPRKFLIRIQKIYVNDCLR